MTPEQCLPLGTWKLTLNWYNQILWVDENVHFVECDFYASVYISTLIKLRIYYLYICTIECKKTKNVMCLSTDDASAHQPGGRRRRRKDCRSQRVRRTLGEKGLPSQLIRVHVCSQKVKWQALGLHEFGTGPLHIWCGFSLVFLWEH